MKRSYVIAVVFAAVVSGWVLSGQFADDDSKTDTASSPVGSEKAELPKVRVRVSTAQSRVNELVMLGKTEASRKVELKSETSGKVVSLAAKKGQRVKKGDIIAKLAMDDRQSLLVAARALLRQREIEFQAAKELSARNFRSKVKLAETQTDLETAKAALETIRLDIRHTVIRAPFDGVLDERPVELGDYVSVGHRVATVIDLSPILVIGEVTEREVDMIKKGADAKARLVSGREFDGRIRYISSESLKTTRTFKVEMENDNLDASIMAGMTAQMRLKLDEVKAHRVSPAVLTLSENGVVGVKAVEAGGMVKFYAIELIADTLDGMWLGGLPQKATLITVGQEFVRAGQKVIAVPEGASTGNQKNDLAVSALKGDKS
ncbi:MAG: efflux transporter periplasmic adaptor subunit [Rhodospirillaceae bacterium]|nr:efflux transporter periplasmic adaptor subunit [Rhodospirillaceae bacterium]